MFESVVLDGVLEEKMQVRKTIQDLDDGIIRYGAKPGCAVLEAPLGCEYEH